MYQKCSGDPKNNYLHWNITINLIQYMWKQGCTSRYLFSFLMRKTNPKNWTTNNNGNWLICRVNTSPFATHRNWPCYSRSVSGRFYRVTLGNSTAIESFLYIFVEALCRLDLTPCQLFFWKTSTSHMWRAGPARFEATSLSVLWLLLLESYVPYVSTLLRSWDQFFR